MSNPVLIVGSMAFDDLELPTTNAKDVVGGSATYCSYSASLFAPVRAVGVVGNDFPQATLDDLAGRGVDVAGVERADGKTFRWAGRYAANLASRETLDTQLNVFADFRPKIPEAFRDSPYVLLGNIHPALQLEVLEQVAQPKFVLADTMNFWIDGELELLKKVLSKIDVLAVNDEEVRQLTGEHNLRKAARAVHALGPRRLVVKRGEHGALLFDDNGAFFTPSFPLETEIDPTGAGDVFAGALLGFLARDGGLDGRTFRRGLLMAATVASFCVEGVGTTEVASLDHDRIAKRLEELGQLVHVGTD